MDWVLPVGPLVRRTMRFCSGVIGRDTPGFEHEMLAVIAPKDTAESDGSLAISFANLVKRDSFPHTVFSTSHSQST